MKRARGFTLVEILITVVLLGILASVVISAVGDSTSCAKNVALARDVQLLRRFIIIYKGQHLEVNPGYPNGNTGANPTQQAFIDQATLASNELGNTAARGTVGFHRGPYMYKLPVNPLNGLNTVQMLANGQAFPAAGDDSHGWIYKAQTGEVRADSAGIDFSGKAYIDY